MLGFIKKDLLMIKSNWKFLTILFIVYIFMSFSNQMDISFILPFMSVMVMISTFSYDTLNKWDNYATALPNGRKNLVKAKYVATVFVIILITLLTTILSILISVFHHDPVNFNELLITIISSIFATLLVQFIMYPIIYKLGIEKARIAIFVLVFGLVIMGGIIINCFDLSFIGKYLNIISDYLIIIIILLTIIFYLISYYISLKIMMKKEY